MSEIPDYKQDLSIDQNALDIEFLNQPNLYMKYSEELAHAERVTKRANEKVKTIRSELVDEANRKLDKPNQQKVESYYRMDDSYKEAKTELHDAEFEQSILTNALWAIGHRKTSLENLVKLMVAQYFAPPAEPRDLDSEVVKKMKQSRRNEGIRKASTRTRRTK